MSFPYKPREETVRIDLGEAPVVIRMRELTAGDLMDERTARAYGRLTGRVVSGAPKREGEQRDDEQRTAAILEIGAEAIGDLAACLSACTTIESGPPRFSLERLPLRCVAPLFEAFGRLHFFDTAGITALGAFGGMRQALAASMSATPSGSQDSATASKSSSAAAGDSMRLSPSPSAPSAMSSNAAEGGEDGSAPSGSSTAASPSGASPPTGHDG